MTQDSELSSAQGYQWPSMIFAGFLLSLAAVPLSDPPHPSPATVPRVRVAVADGHPIFRDGLRRLLETDPRLLVVSESGERASIMALVLESAPDILLLGLATSDQNAVETLRDLAASNVLVRTIVLTDCVDTPEVLRALQLGARGVILKE